MPPAAHDRDHPRFWWVPVGSPSASFVWVFSLPVVSLFDRDLGSDTAPAAAGTEVGEFPASDSVRGTGTIGGAFCCRLEVWRIWSNLDWSF